jgi:outer membrane protein OmpA-like peptidoglycan-associated protein
MEATEMRKKFFVRGMLVLSAMSLLCVIPAFAQSSSETGKLKIHVNPKQAYVFVDGKAIRDGSQTMELAAGNHTVGVFNYGYLPKSQAVQINAGQTTALDVALQASGDKVSGPFADLEFKGDPRAAVLLNGTTPAYFVGHVDEFDWDWIWHQRLLVHPGTYHVTVTHEGNTIWTGEVTAKAGQKVIINLNNNGQMTTKNWKEGNTLGPQPRFHAGIASATVPVAPVTAALSAQSTDLSCGQGTTLNWNAANAVDTSISSVGEVPNNGDRSVTPTHDTTYVLTAKGPGGESTQSLVVHVNAEPTAKLALSEPQVRYHRVGDRVVEQGSATLNWSASNANSAKIEPFNSNALSGSRTITADSKQTSTGPVNENLTYTLTATNACGGTVTKTATLHVVGSIDPPPSTTLASVFFPTNYPTIGHPKAGLVTAEKMVLDSIATQFKNFGLYEHKAGLVVVGHADVRGSRRYNEALSKRRAELIRDYLISKGVPADELTIRAEGKDKQLDQKTVEAQLSKTDTKPAKWMTKNEKTTWLAYNRRTDLVLEPTGQQSALVYPNGTTEAMLVWQRKEPPLKKVESASSTTASVAQASLNQSGN